MATAKETKPKQAKTKKETAVKQPEQKMFRKLTREEKMKYLTGKWD